MRSFVLSLLLGLSLAAARFAPVAHAAPADEWRSRTIYQVVTDRFAPSDCWGQPCSDLNSYCGGTWEGLSKRLTYITDMGFDAVWISPVSKQGSDAFGAAGYHGYWPADMYSLDPAFGSQQQLQALVHKCHNSGMFVMFDMVINHMGHGDVSSFNPFNASSDYHDCDGCYGPDCDIDPAGIFASPAAAASSKHCKLAGLPDLNHSSPGVLSRMQHVFDHMLAAYKPDGLRLDAAGHSDTSFCAALTAGISNSTFTVGELFLVDNISLSMGVVADFVKAGGASSAFSFPMAIALEKVLREHNVHDMLWLAQRRAEYLQLMGSKVHDMLTFVENHDLPRWLHTNYSSVTRYQNALTYVMFMEGIPVIYYGTEQGIADNQLHPPRTDPRPPLWHTHYSHDHPLWLFLRVSLAYRKADSVWAAGIAQQHYVDAHTLVLSRGSFVIVLTDWGEERPQKDSQLGQGGVITLQVALHVSAGGVGLYRADPAGAPQVFYLGHVAPPESFIIPTEPRSSCSSLYGRLKGAYQAVELARPIPKAGSSSSTPPAPAFDPLSIPILHVALEYALPQFGLNSQLMYGGMGLVVSTFLQHWPGPMALVAPLYKACYPEDDCGGTPFDRPSFIPPGQAPLLALTVDVARGWQLPVEVFKLETVAGAGPAAGQPRTYYLVQAELFRQARFCKFYRCLIGCAPAMTYERHSRKVQRSIHVCLVCCVFQGVSARCQLPVEGESKAGQGPAAGQPRTYCLVQAELFRRRGRADMYSFADEGEMLTWLAVFNKAVAAVVLAEGVTHVQLHDYHGALSLQYLPEELRPAVIYVAHNAHYNATFPIPTPERKRQVYEHLNLTPEAAPLTEHNGSLDVLRGAVMHMRLHQLGCGVVAVSPRYAAQISKKLSCFWDLVPLGRPDATHIRGITNALDTSDSLAADASLNLDALQALYGLSRGQQYSLAAFVGRLTQQKGVDVIAEAAAALLAKHPLLQLVVVGPAGDPIGSAAAAKLCALQLSGSFPGRMFCPLDRYVAGAEKELLLRATDFCLLPSRFEPCGLVDIEFGWNGCLVIGHDTGGLGKMPGVYFTAQASHLGHLARKFEAAVDAAMALTVSERASKTAQALARRFPVDGMMGAYADTWMQVDCCFQQAKDTRLAQHQQQQQAARFFANNLGPGILLLSFVLLEDVLVGSRPLCGLHLQDNLPPWLPRGMSLLAPSFIGFAILSTAFAPLWFWLGAKLKPATYIRAAALAVAASYLLAFVALYASSIITLAVGLVGCVNLVAAPIMSMGLLGQEEVDVFEVGRSMLALTWLCSPAALTQAYHHMHLSYRRQWSLLKHLSCFWLSLAAGTCDTLALLLTGFLVVAITDSLAVLASFQATAFGCSAAAVLWNWRALSSRAAELHLNGAMLLLAGLPLYQALKAAVLLARLPTGVMLGVCAMLDLAMGGRSSILGLAGFVTLPSREVVSMWQFLGIMIGSVAMVLVVGIAFAAQHAAITASPWLLVGLIGGCEVLRCGCVLLLGRRYSQENLSAP
ncbi:hypothetical protein OEZ85_005176 [Tetradesmus obliquus]|uniref:Glycosyl hydrolase family 13 catalytic domain-containing protein n=1 Tax=Tetradesmus obliquus TaxID=3088 RepID=A0ABY8UKQ6_TETOB|nr:hypothetical protein OEZ85_005176 [Tetradesmus obliquus]